MSIHWKKKGLIYCPDGKGFFKTHATRPIPYFLKRGVLRIFFSSRSAEDVPYPTFIDVQLDDPRKIIAIGEAPMMQLGRPGAFDDSGITPVSILRHDGEDRMYYVGWKRRRYAVSIEASIGLAILQNDGDILVRAYEGPILGQDINHPLMTAAPFVLFEEGRYKMWYCSTTDWRFPDGDPEPIYTVFYAESGDGIHWNPHGEPIIDYRFDGEIISAPWVLHVKDKYLMWYSTRGYATKAAKNFTIGYAESPDGINWRRLDEDAGIVRSENGWDSEMVCYPSFYFYKDQIYMFYSGNGVGRGGIGYAVTENVLM
jgi:hypothetical protein